MNQHYEELKIEDVQLDMDNPRIAKYIEMYNKESLNSEQVALALGSGVESSGQTNYNSLYNSIKTNKGIIHPIIVNHDENGNYVVIEGNTRLQIYKEFKELNIEGNWNTIPSIVYEKLDQNQIHAIRLQSHLVGPREWDAYSKAKYLCYLSNVENLPMSQIVDFCGGKSSEITLYITAYKDMENYYRTQLSADDEFDQREFSKFVEVEKANVKEALINKFSMKDFAKWVIDGHIEAAYRVRNLPQILADEEATKVLLRSNLKEAYEVTIKNKPEYKDLNTTSTEQLCVELTKRLNNMTFREYKEIRDENNEIKANLTDLKENLDLFVSEISGE